MIKIEFETNTQCVSSIKYNEIHLISTKHTTGSSSSSSLKNVQL